MWDLINTSIYASILLSIAIGIIGSLIVINKATAITGSIAHGSFGGIGIGIFLGTSILLTTTIFTVILALILALITIFYRHRADSLIGVIWAVGMSIGIIFLSLAPGYNADALSYLFGNILLVENKDLLLMGIVDLILIVSILVLYNRFLAMSYDMEFLKIRGINSNLLFTYFLVLTSLTIVISVRAIGIILILALFTIPPLIAEKFTKRFYQMIILSSILAFIFMSAGIIISYFYDLSPTPIIVIIAATGLFLSLFKKT
ncbi:metal ABC transporter permease [Caminibacter pacificus]|uniref:Metal ABC transporter permease n=1 Tax=Caminibacter pacificus TaxID=1424653 RepID=A0AAJ4RBA9_9BACT|nr:metal ABC transporter permease [Caminibacter pacificus]QCI29162.1 metal ABC transporter permease [Caminibacter pacificus]ROR38805.1 zinc transport system permease protein [Caminibacter pacificus]